MCLAEVVALTNYILTRNRRLLLFNENFNSPGLIIKSEGNVILTRFYEPMPEVLLQLFVCGSLLRRVASVYFPRFVGPFFCL